MDEIEGSEYLVLAAMTFHLIVAPSTKVEESFNVQATHDILFVSPLNISQYDHQTFPGVVPRTFTGPLWLSIASGPLSLLLRWLQAGKIWQLVLVRWVLGMGVMFNFLKFARTVKKIYGRETAFWLRVITATQFHFIFYSSRPLPNTFALFIVLLILDRYLNNRMESAVRWATFAVFVFRCELVLFFAPLFIVPIATGRLPIFGWDGAVANGIRSLIKSLALTIPVDSFYWQRLVWPEGEVALFNVIMNKSHEYGVSPFLWYFYSALPRALLLSIFLVPLGILLDRRLYTIVFPAAIFVFLYSFLPHKELRFIIYVIPILNLAAAVFFARMEINKNKSWKRYVLYLGCCAHLAGNFIGTGFQIYAATGNYPGASVMNYVQYQMRFDRQKPVKLHIDNACAQTGVNQFLHYYDAWSYDKTENATVEDLKDFDFLLVGTYGTDLHEIIKNYSNYFRPIYSTNSFHKFNLRKLKNFPYFWPEVILKEKAAVLRNLNY